MCKNSAITFKHDQFHMNDRGSGQLSQPKNKLNKRVYHYTLGSWKIPWAHQAPCCFSALYLHSVMLLIIFLLSSSLILWPTLFFLVCRYYSASICKSFIVFNKIYSVIVNAIHSKLDKEKLFSHNFCLTVERMKGSEQEDKKVFVAGFSSTHDEEGIKRFKFKSYSEFSHFSAKRTKKKTLKVLYRSFTWHCYCCCGCCLKRQTSNK